MFTGIVERMGKLKRLARRGGVLQLTVTCEDFLTDVVPHDSIALSGVCLTATAVTPPDVVFDVVEETVSKTTLALFSPGAPLNLEKAVSASGRFGGHFVTGHVDGAAVFAGRNRTDEAAFSAPRDLVRDMIPKGSVALDGVSLTIASIEADRFTVALIPWTLAHTTLGQLRRGDSVNVETDLIGKWVRRIMSEGGRDGLTPDKLVEHGFT